MTVEKTHTLKVLADKGIAARLSDTKATEEVLDENVSVTATVHA